MYIIKQRAKNKIVKLSPVSLILFLAVTNLSAQTLIVSDDFENELASFWGSTPWTGISDEFPKDGNYSLRFQFNGVPEGEDSWAEARFDLGDEYTELSIKFDLYIPSNYEHRAHNAGQGWTNNKFFRLWKDAYDDSEKVGASMWNEFDNGSSQTGNNTYNSRLSLDYRVTTGTSSTNLTEDFIAQANDLGQWMSIVIYIKAPTDTTDTEFRFYKNGQLFLEDTFNNNWEPGTQGYQKGYLLGWANSGFTEETILYIDNVAFYDGDIMSSELVIFANGFE